MTRFGWPTPSGREGLSLQGKVAGLCDDLKATAEINTPITKTTGWQVGKDIYQNLGNKDRRKDL